MKETNKKLFKMISKFLKSVHDISLNFGLIGIFYKMITTVSLFEAEMDDELSTILNFGFDIYFQTFKVLGLGLLPLVLVYCFLINMVGDNKKEDKLRVGKMKEKKDLFDKLMHYTENKIFNHIRKNENDIILEENKDKIKIKDTEHAMKGYFYKDKVKIFEFTYLKYHKLITNYTCNEIDKSVFYLNVAKKLTDYIANEKKKKTYDIEKENESVGEIEQERERLKLKVKELLKIDEINESIEEKHLLERMNHDIIDSVYETYQKLDQQEKEIHKVELLEKYIKLEQKIEEVRKKVDKKNERELMKQFKIIDELTKS